MKSSYQPSNEDALIRERVAELRSFTINPYINNDLLVKCVTMFCDHVDFLVNDALTTAGITWESVLSDLSGIKNILANPSLETIVALHAQIKSREEEYSKRKNKGIGSAVAGGFLLAATAGATVLTSGLPILLLGGTALAGGTMLPSGTAVIVDAANKIGILATCEQNILLATITSLFNKYDYNLIACASLKVILLDAQKRGKNSERDQILNVCYDIVAKQDDAAKILRSLKEAVMNLKGNSPNSKAAIALETVIQDIQNKYLLQLQNENRPFEILQISIEQMIDKAAKLGKQCLKTLISLRETVEESAKEDNHIDEIKANIESLVSRLNDDEYEGKLKVLIENAGLNQEFVGLRLQINS